MSNAWGDCTLSLVGNWALDEEHFVEIQSEGNREAKSSWQTYLDEMGPTTWSINQVEATLSIKDQTVTSAYDTQPNCTIILRGISDEGIIQESTYRTSSNRICFVHKSKDVHVKEECFIRVAG